MKKMLGIVTLLAAFAASPALAFQCPALMAEIDAALPQAQLSQSERDRVEELRQQGEEFHQAGDHERSEEALNEAREILGLT